MSFKPLALTAAITLALSLPTLAPAQILVEDAYARASSPAAQSGAAFMQIVNQGDQDDRVISATSDVSERVELHTHLEDANGVMRMVEVEDGFPLAAGETYSLARGGDHIMFLGLTRPLVHGEEVEVTITFEQAEPLTVMIPVDLERQDHGAMGHGGHDHDHNHDHGTDG